MKNINVVDHGTVFNTNHWYTFYCEECGRQVTRDMIECLDCGTELFWE